MNTVFVTVGGEQHCTGQKVGRERKEQQVSSQNKVGTVLFCALVTRVPSTRGNQTSRRGDGWTVGAASRTQQRGRFVQHVHRTRTWRVGSSPEITPPSDEVDTPYGTLLYGIRYMCICVYM